MSLIGCLLADTPAQREIAQWHKTAKLPPKTTCKCVSDGKLMLHIDTSWMKFVAMFSGNCACRPIAMCGAWQQKKCDAHLVAFNKELSQPRQCSSVRTQKHVSTKYKKKTAEHNKLFGTFSASSAHLSIEIGPNMTRSTAYSEESGRNADRKWYTSNEQSTLRRIKTCMVSCDTLVDNHR